MNTDPVLVPIEALIAPTAPAAEWWCPVTQSTTCTASPDQQRACSAC